MNKDYYPGFALVVIVILLKIAILFWIVPQFVDVFPGLYQIDKFPDGYADIAMNLVQGHGYRFFPDTADTLLRTPAYPLLLSVVFAVFGKSLIAAKFLNMILAFLTAWLVIRITALITENKFILILAPLLFLFHPAIIFAESRAGIAIVTSLCVALYIYVQHKAITEQSFRGFFLAGIVLGIASLIRSTPILFPLFLLVYLLLVRPGNLGMQAIFAKVGVLIMGVAIVIAPWTIRNHSLVDEFIPTMSVLGISAYQGQYICRHIETGKGFDVLGKEAAQLRNELAEALGYDFKKTGHYQFFFNAKDEVEFSDYLKNQVIQDYVAEPGLFIKCSLLNAVHFWITGQNWNATVLNAIVQVPFVILFLAGIYLVVKQGKFELIGPVLLFIFYFYAVHIPVLSVVRYSVPLIPLMSVFAAIAIARIINRRLKTNANTSLNFL